MRRPGSGSALGATRRTSPRWWPLAGAVALAAALAGCPAFPSAGATGLRYRSTWDTAGVTLRPEGGWSVETDRGYTATVERGWLVAHSIELVPCPEHETEKDTGAETGSAARLGPTQPARPATERGRMGLPAGSLGPRVAFAGHGDESDPTKLVASRVEDLGRPAAVELGGVDLADIELAAAYCEGFHLVAASVQASTGLAEDGVAKDLLGASLILEGTWRAPGNEASRPLRLRTVLAWGGTGALGEDPSTGDATEADAGRWRPDQARGVPVVTVERALGRVFDGVDLATVDEETLARAVLRNLAEHQRWRIGR